MTCPDGTGTQGLSYAYDQYGNRWQQNVTSGSGGTSSLTFSGGNNRIDGFSYDAAGNLLNDGVHSYTYDAENRIATVDGGATSYFYDAEGRRLEKRANGTPTFDYFYGRDGNLLILIQANGAPLYQEVYAGGMHLATHTLNAAQNGTDTYFHHNDWLGTERARTDWAGNLCETVTSLPFGDDQNISTTCPEGDVSPMHFTGKERDSESGLDNFGARYNSSQMGRFMSPDHISIDQDRLLEPQRLNLYEYAVDNPLVYVDRDGRDPERFWQSLKNTAEAIQVAFQKSAAVFSGNPNFSFSNISAKDLNSIAANVVLLAATGGEDEFAEFALAGKSTAAVALDTNVLIDIEKGAVSAGSLGSNLVVSPTAFNEFLAGTTPEKAAQFLKENNITIQGVGNSQVYTQVLQAGLKNGLTQNDAQILATAASDLPPFSAQSIIRHSLVLRG